MIKITSESQAMEQQLLGNSRMGVGSHEETAALTFGPPFLDCSKFPVELVARNFREEL